MVLPTQATSGLVATNLVQSMLDSVEEQRKQDQEKATGQKRDPVVEARISASVEAKRAREKIAEALFGSGGPDPVGLKMDLIERLSNELGIDTEEARSAYRLGKALEDALKDMLPNDVRDLSEKIGLEDLGVSMDTLLKAIKNPYGDDNKRLEDALIKRANGGKLDAEVQRVVQRLEDVADPKTLEELKLGPQGYDPTRVEDAETRAERKQDIENLEASEKLEDVQEMQDAVEEQNDKITKPAAPGEPVPPANAAEADMIVVLGATAEQTRDAAQESDAKPATEVAAQAPSDIPSDDTTINEMNAEAIEDAVAKEAEDALAEVLPISVDEIGLYELLKKKPAA